MKIIKDCWNSVGAFECQYGAHLFEDSTAKIYVNNWLAVSGELYELFYRKNDEGYVGHCLLVFCDVKQFNFSVRTYIQRHGKVIWNEPVTFSYSGLVQDGTTLHALEGSLHGFPSSVSISVEAQRFELHILEKDEPARKS
jgi:hypothetical protein